MPVSSYVGLALQDPPSRAAEMLLPTTRSFQPHPRNVPKMTEIKSTHPQTLRGISSGIFKVTPRGIKVVQNTLTCMRCKMEKYLVIMRLELPRHRYRKGIVRVGWLLDWAEARYIQKSAKISHRTPEPAPKLKR